MEENTDKQPATTATKPRNRLIALLLSLLFPGLGQVYNGQPIKAAVLFGLLLLLPFLGGLFRWTTFFYGFISLIAIESSIRIYIIIDALKNAKRQNEYVLKPYNTWYYYTLIAIGMFAVLSVYDFGKVSGIQTFIIPTTSNSPTFHRGDMLVADLKAYSSSEPDYGDIVVYSRPDGQAFTFRVVGLPNDTIELIDNIVSVNGKLSNVRFIKETTIDEIPVFEFEEELPNGHKHLIYKFKIPYTSSKSNLKNIVVPADSYYFLGDYRDNAEDSRYEGFISRNRIFGRIIFSYWGKTGTERMNIDFTDK